MACVVALTLFECTPDLSEPAATLLLSRAALEKELRLLQQPACLQIKLPFPVHVQACYRRDCSRKRVLTVNRPTFCRAHSP